MAENSAETIRVLLLSSAPSTTLLEAAVGADDVAVSRAEDLDAAFVRLAAEPIQTVVVDGTDDDPLDAIEQLVSNYPAVSILLYLPDEEPELIDAALATGAADYVTPASSSAIRARLRRVAGSTPDAILTGSTDTTAVDRLEEKFYALDADGRITHWNQAMAEATDVPANEAVGTNLFDLFPSIVGTDYASAIERGLDADDAGVIKERPDETVAEESNEIWVHHGDAGVTVHTVTVPPEQRRDARLLEDLLSGLLADIGDTIYFKDEESRFVRVSESKARETGATREEIRGKSDFDFMPEREAKRRYEDEQQVMETGEPFVEEDERWVGPDGEVRWYYTIKLPRYDEDGNVVGTFGLSRNVTQRVEQERDLERQNQRLERLIETISHDLRGPLSAAAGRLELAREAADPGEHIDSAIDSLEQIESLIDDLLTMAREGRAVESPEDIRFEDVAADAWEPFADGEATLDLRIPETATVRGDRERIRRLFENLFRNAIQHGGEDVTVTVDETPEGFTVFDDGRGIPEDEREHVFEHGYTTDEAGTGFGLAIVSEIADAHGWSIDVVDGPTGGAQFEIKTKENPLPSGEKERQSSEAYGRIAE